MILSNCTLIFLLGSNFEVFFLKIIQKKLKHVKREESSLVYSMISFCNKRKKNRSSQKITGSI